MPIQENEFESAICKCFPLLLPDLATAGYSIESRQAILHGRRLDLVLRRNATDLIVAELKVGSPAADDLIAQVLDYEKCFKLTKPDQQLQLMVISTRITDQIRRRLEKHGIQARKISEEEVLQALRCALPEPTVLAGIHLDETERVVEIRRLLTDKDILHIPEGLDFSPPWNQFKAFLALAVRQKQKHKDLWKKNPYVQLYPQAVNAALLYHVSVKSASRAPIHINRKSKGWREDYWKKIEHCVTYVHRDIGKQTVFDHYRVDDWDEFASALEIY
jgi:hypothetical protein